MCKPLSLLSFARVLTSRNLAILVSATCVSVAVFACTSYGPIVFDLVSPDGQYSVAIAGHLEAPHDMFRSHAVIATITRVGGQHTSDVKLYNGDSFDPGFGELYGAPRWVQRNALQFPSQSPDKVGAELTAENRSDRSIPVLVIDASDLVLLLDVPPHSSIALPGSGRMRSPMFVSAEVWTTAPNPAATTGVTVHDAAQIGGIPAYVVSYDGTQLTIDSRYKQ